MQNLRGKISAFWYFQFKRKIDSINKVKAHCIPMLTYYSMSEFLNAELKLLSAWEVTEVMFSGTELVGFLKRSLSRTLLYIAESN